MPRHLIRKPHFLIPAAILLACLALTGAGFPASASASLYAQPGSIRRDVTYCMGDNVPLKMDIYFPQKANEGGAPALLYVHGGAWSSGDKSWVQSLLNTDMLTSRGFLVASIDYRLAPRYKWPAQIEDVKCAVRYLRAEATTLNIDPNRIGAWGESAGGHLVSLLALAGPQAGFEGKGGYPEQSSRIGAVVDICGPADLANFSADNYTFGLAQLILGINTVRSAVAGASPVTYVDKDAPPFLILQGDKDPVVPPAQSQELYRRLTDAGAPATLTIVQNTGHILTPTGGTISPSPATVKESIVAFFEHNLAPDALNSHYFVQTGKVVRGTFLRYWLEHGGLAQQGYPVSEEISEPSESNGKPYTVQYFERAVMESHPENKPPNDVQLALLGSFRYKQKYPQGAPQQKANSDPGTALFSQTGKYVGGAFLKYWQAHGGVAQQGYPISNELTEVSDLDGKPYTVQYFERAVFEFHPENPAPNNVLLQQLGTFRYASQHQQNKR